MTSDSVDDANGRRLQERDRLRRVVAQWNANRLDLFELSQPDDNLEFHGVMRFYYQDAGQKVATKCIRVSSSATAQHVLHTLIEKFRPDMRMLSTPRFALYEIHESGGERALEPDERPLYVQLNWHQDDLEGRFLLRNLDVPHEVLRPNADISNVDVGFKRKLSKREKKEIKKQEKVKKIQSANENDSSVAEKLYTELPETSFTRSISNPEAVMRRRRQQKLEKKLQQFRSRDGGPDTGGTLKIYGESLCSDVPYKTLLLSVNDSAAAVVCEMLNKYGLFREDPSHYCLVQMVTEEPQVETKEYRAPVGPYKEYVLEDGECPLSILMNHSSVRGSIMFHIRRRPADQLGRRRKKKPQQQQQHSAAGSDIDRSFRGHDHTALPFLLEINADGSDVRHRLPQRFPLHLCVTEVGGQRSVPTSTASTSSAAAAAAAASAGGSGSGGSHQFLQLLDVNLASRHCVLAHTEGLVTVTPCSRHTDTYVNGKRVYETTILQNGCVVQFGRVHKFRFVDQSRDIQSHSGHSGNSAHSGNSGNSMTTRQSITDSVGEVPDLETTFDVNGHVETYSAANDTTPHHHQQHQQQHQLQLQQHHHHQQQLQQSAGSRSSNYGSAPSQQHQQQHHHLHQQQQQQQRTSAGDPILPAVLEFREESEDSFLRAIITNLQPSCLQFKLAPTYTLYMATRFRASTHYRPELSPTDRAVKLTEILSRIASMIQQVIQARSQDANVLAFWLANASEYLHFLKQDRHIGAYSRDAQDILADCVQTSFWCLVDAVQKELSTSIVHFLEDRDDVNEEEGTTSAVLSSLGNTMALLRRCRVNAALTIQLFSQLFHYINMRVFNTLVGGGAGAGGGGGSSSSSSMSASPGVNYCTRLWGVRLKRRLNRVEAWADKLGLELAADCHLARVLQASYLLTAPKNNVDDLTTISSTCYNLNSLQLRALLCQYRPASDEPSIPPELVNNIVRISENTSDEMARQEGRSVSLLEDEELQLPFLLPEDGYSCDIVRGIPNGLAEFIAPLQHAGMARMSEQVTSCGYWTIYMTDHELTQLQRRSPSVQSLRVATVARASVASTKSPPPPPGTAAGADSPAIQLIRIQKSNTGMGLSIVAAKAAGSDRLGIYIKSVVAGGAADSDGRLAAGDQLLSVDEHSLLDISQEQAAEYMMRTGPVVTLRVAKQAAVFHGLSTLLSQPSPDTGKGSRRWREEGHNYPAGMIHSSKSVPALNAGVCESGVTAAHSATLPFGLAGTSSSTNLTTPASRQHHQHHQQHHQHQQQQQQQQYFASAAAAANDADDSVHMSSAVQHHHQQQQHTRAQSSLGLQWSGAASPHHHQHPHQQQQQQHTTPTGYPSYPHQPSVANVHSLHQQHQHHQQQQQQQHLQQQQQQHLQRQQQQESTEQPSPLNTTPQMYGGMARSVSEQDHLRYRPTGVSSRNNLLLPASPLDSPPAAPPPAAPPPAAAGGGADVQSCLSSSTPHLTGRESPHTRLNNGNDLAKRLAGDAGDGDADDYQQRLSQLRFQDGLTAPTGPDRSGSGDTLQQQQQQQRGGVGGGGQALSEVERRAAAARRQQQMLRKQAELAAADQAEQQLLREAQRRRQQLEQQPAAAAAAAPGCRLDSLLAATGAPVGGTGGQMPLPPERSVSFGVVQRPVAPSVPPKPELSAPNPAVTTTAAATAGGGVSSTRRVQFHEPPPAHHHQQQQQQPPSLDTPERYQQSHHHHDHDHDDDATNYEDDEEREEYEEHGDSERSQQSPHLDHSPLNAVPTPGVIGAQEVYRDPRARRLAQLEHCQRASGVIPEQLTFREKMKMFATESGEPATPRDKLKNSSRQRDLELYAHGH